MLKQLLFVFLMVQPAALFADITGTVYDPVNAPVPRATVHLLGGAFSRVTSTDAEGRFRFPAESDGAYTLLAAAPGLSGLPQKITVRRGSAAAELRLELAARSETVTVTAERAEMPISAVGSSTTVLDRRELDESHADNVADALRHVPGLSLVQTGRRGGIIGLFARGGESDFNLVMVDGVKVNDFGGQFDFANFPLESVERIEVVRGPQSALYGLNAIGAVVHIITRRPTAPLQARAQAEGGSFGTARWSLGAGGRSGRFGWNTDVMRHTSDGVVPNDNYRNEAGSLHLDYEFSDAARLRYSLVADANDVGAPGPYRVAPVNRVQRGKENVYINGLDLEARLGRFRHKLSGSAYQARRSFTSQFGPFETRQFRAVGSTESSVALSDGDTLAFGFEFQRERFRNTFVTNQQSVVFPLVRNNLGWFVENRWERGGRLFLNAGLRLENIRTSALPPDAFGSRPAIGARSKLALNPKVSAAFLPRPGGGTRLHASAGTGIRAPDGFEIAFTNHLALEPERTASFDIGVEQAFARRRAIVDLTYFYNRFHDLIITLSGEQRGLSRYRSDNLANSRAQGLELSGALRPAAWIGFSGHYTWLKSEVLSLDKAPGRAPSPFLIGEPLLRRPEHSAAYLVTWNVRAARLTMTTGATMRSATRDVDPIRGLGGGTLPNPGYIRPDLGAEIALTPEVALYGRLFNFSDSRYEEALGFPALRRNFVAGVKFRWR